MTKQFIIQEIKRTAAANGGVPLGQRTFEIETGVKYTEWFGKIWARWSDALQEAGFEPNKLTAAFEESDILRKYADFTRELRRLPAMGDLRLKKRHDPTFPNDTTLQNRFGRKSELVKHLRKFCSEEQGYEIVVELCDNYVAPRPQRLEQGLVDEPEDGFVYLTKAGRYFKIGKTNSAGRREREIALQLPEKSSTVHVIRTDDPTGIEAYWHQRFAPKRRNGEWFELSHDDVAVFKRRKFM